MANQRTQNKDIDELLAESNANFFKNKAKNNSSSMFFNASHNCKESDFAKSDNNRTANDATGKRTLLGFLNHINSFGVQVLNNFEVEFSALEGLTFFISTFELPGSKNNTCEIYYDGIKMTIPVNYEHEHDFSMTVINDAQGFIYTALKTFIEIDSYNRYVDTGNYIVLKAFTGQINGRNVFYPGSYPVEGDLSIVQYPGARIVLKGIHLNTISGLTYGLSNNEIQTFTVSGSLIEYSHLPTYLNSVISNPYRIS